MGDVGIDGKIGLRCISKKLVVKVCIELSLRIGSNGAIL